MSTSDPIKQDDRSETEPGHEPAKAPERKDEKRELADTEVGAISGGGNVHNPPPITP